jgi:hypothetical protein
MRRFDQNEQLAFSIGAKWIPAMGGFFLTPEQLDHLIVTAKNYGWLERDLETKDKQ